MLPFQPQRRKGKRARLSERQKRNYGKSYRSPYTGREVPTRRILKPRCSSKYCHGRDLHCDEFDQNERQCILDAYYNMGDLQSQRQWIQSHIIESEPSYKRHKAKENSRKKQTISYYLPKGDSKLTVCRKMFLNTVGISERQVRTVLKKKDRYGVLQNESRGRRTSYQAEKDAKMRQKIKDHINRFPRMESHYCRAKTSDQFLSPTLTVSKMYELYERETESTERGSFALYYSIFKEMGLKFHSPKKDLCGICDSFYKASENEREKLQPKFDEHKFQKTSVRQIKTRMKEKALENKAFCAATFDLQQVMYIPISNRCEIFYKRRLACYNFTVYELSSKDGHCYFWHEAQAKRGSNEISSHLYQFLMKLDDRKVTEAVLFADSCAGQNKNSILPAMLMYVVQNSQHLKTITLYFYETNQSE